MGDAILSGKQQICTSRQFCPFATNGSKRISLFLKEDGGLGEGENFFSREKKFSPSPNSTPVAPGGLFLLAGGLSGDFTQVAAFDFAAGGCGQSENVFIPIVSSKD